LNGVRLQKVGLLVRVAPVAPMRLVRSHSAIEQKVWGFILPVKNPFQAFATSSIDDAKKSINAGVQYNDDTRGAHFRSLYFICRGSINKLSRIYPRVIKI